MIETTMNAGVAETPVLSVVVTIVDGGNGLRRFLDALIGQVGGPSMEILLPYDASIPEVAELRHDYPDLRFVAMGETKTMRPITTAAGQHELYDRRRAAGLAVAKGRLLAMLEDRAPPRPDWARNMTRIHEQPYGAVGGAIECAQCDMLNWTFYACDFSRYSLPFESGPRQWISDINVCYKRRVLDATRDIWNERFNEAQVHWELLERGETLFLSSEVIVDYRSPYTSLSRLLPERFHWGRLFGHVRAEHVGILRRLAYIVSGPLIPLRLFVRHAITQRQKGNFGRFLRAAPTMLLLLTAWTSGEVWGYITKKP